MPWYVNDEIVDDNAVREEARMMRPHYMESVGEVDPIDAEMQLREWARENVIERMLLRKAALADPDPVPPEVLAQALESIKTEAGGQAGCGSRTSDEEVREQIEYQYRVERLLARVQSDVEPPRSKEVAEVYKRNKERFHTPELIHAAHIVKNVDEQNDEASAQAGIEAAQAELQAGTPFHEVADRFSDCAGNGGDLGWFPRGQMVDEFDDAVFDVPTGSTTGIFRSPFGFHIATVYERKPAGLRPLKDVEQEIIAALLQDRRQKAVENYLDELRSKAEIRQAKAAQ